MLPRVILASAALLHFVSSRIARNRLRLLFARVRPNILGELQPNASGVRVLLVLAKQRRSAGANQIHCRRSDQMSRG